MTRADELRASLEELRSTLAAAPPEMRPLLEQQIAALEHTAAMLDSLAPSMAEMAALRPALTPGEQAFFTPEPPAEIPTWVPDQLTRADVTDALLRCPAGARVYALDDSVGCGIPTGGIPIRHGLQLWFHPSGRLRSQCCYEQGLSRWAISYHATGARERAGFYADRERLVYLEHGLHTSYAPNGTIVAQAHFIGGHQHGWSKFWEDDGYPIGATLYDGGRATQHVIPGRSHA